MANKRPDSKPVVRVTTIPELFMKKTNNLFLLLIIHLFMPSSLDWNSLVGQSLIYKSLIHSWYYHFHLLWTMWFMSYVVNMIRLDEETWLTGGYRWWEFSILVGFYCLWRLHGGTVQWWILRTSPPCDHGGTTTLRTARFSEGNLEYISSLLFVSACSSAVLKSGFFFLPVTPWYWRKCFLRCSCIKEKLFRITDVNHRR